MLQPNYDQRIRIESKQVTTDPDYGTATVTWAEFTSIWAQVQDQLPSKAETQVNAMRVAKQAYRIRARYITGITADMRVVQLSRGNRILQITSAPAELGRKDGIEFMAEAYTTDAQS